MPLSMRITSFEYVAPPAGQWDLLGGMLRGRPFKLLGSQTHVGTRNHQYDVYIDYISNVRIDDYGKEMKLNLTLFRPSRPAYVHGSSRLTFESLASKYTPWRPREVANPSQSKDG